VLYFDVGFRLQLSLLQVIVYTSELHLAVEDNIMMDDWKRKTLPVFTLERPNERFVDSQSQQCTRPSTEYDVNNNQCILCVFVSLSNVLSC